MMQRKPMKRTGPIKPKPAKRRVTNPLKRNALGASTKGYKETPRDRDHMARVAARGCLICGAPAQFHHVDIVLPKGMGPKVSDYIGAGLCPKHHTGEGFVGAKDCAHMGEREFWIRHGLDIGAWIIRLLTMWYSGRNENAQAAIDAIKANRRDA